MFQVSRLAILGGDGVQLLLNVENLVKRYAAGKSFGSREFLAALDGVSLSIQIATTLALVGESGSGATGQLPVPVIRALWTARRGPYPVR